MKILCYGDSNTWGYDPRDYLEQPYGPEDRWVDCFSRFSGWETVNLGLNGRELPRSEKEIRNAIALLRLHLPAEQLIILLGTNDIWNRHSPEEAGERLRTFLTALRKDLPALPVLVLCPPPLQLTEEDTEDINAASLKLPAVFQPIAKEFGTDYANLGEWNLPLAFDGAHFTAEAHHMIADKLWTLMQKET